MMKKNYLLIVFTLTALMSNAQSKTWIGPNNGLWSEPTNWSPEGTPTGLTDVLIPSGTVVLINGQANADTVTVQTGAVMNVSGTDDYPEFVNSLLTIETDAILNFEEGNFSGELNMYGTMNVIGNEQKEIWYNTQNIYGTLNIPNNGELGLRNNVLVIAPGGECLIENRGSIYIAAFNAEFRNEGLIEKLGTDTFSISTIFKNSDAQIDVEGRLQINTAQITNGVYNVADASSLVVLGTTNLEGTLTGELNGTFRTEGNILPSEDNTTTLNFTGSSYYDWAGGTLSFGNLTNNSHLVISGAASSPIQIGASSLINNGAMDITTTENIWLYTAQSAIVNSTSGVLNLMDDIEISGGTTFNEGLIKKFTGEGISEFNKIENINGTIQIETGTLNFTNGGTFTNGTYNVYSGASMTTLIGSAIYLSGTLTGTLDGPWKIYTGLNIPENTEAIINFVGESSVEWFAGNITGGGTLISQSKMDLVSYVNNYKQIVGNSTLQNEDTITMLGESSLWISGGSLHNTTSGVIDLKNNTSINSAFSPNLLNEGLFKKTDGDELMTIYFLFENNEPGFIQCETGEIRFNNIEGNGNFSGMSLLDLTSSFMITGNVSPGGELGTEIGTLTFSNGYNSDSASTIKIDIAGTTAGDEYDRVEVIGNAAVSGNIDVALNYSPSIDDEFIIMQATGIVTCDGLPTTVTGTYQGLNYVFDVVCNDNNITLQTLSVGVEEIDHNLTAALFPIPMQEQLTITLSKEITSKKAKLILTNVMGQRVKEIAILFGTSEIHLERAGISSGMYQLNLITENGIILTKKLIVN